MTTYVKICGMTDAAAISAAVTAGADAIGFVFFAGSPRNIEPARAAALAAAVPPHVRKVAVTLHPDQSLIDALQSVFRPDVLQTDIGDFPGLTLAAGIEKWPVVREGSVPAGGLPAGTFVYEGKMSGKGKTVDWQVAAEIAAHGQMILAGGLTVDNVGSAVSQVMPYGVDVSSAVESRPGVKDPALIEAFVERVKAR
jgi:phosphoribosylanthranilate isomerase